MTSPEVSCSRSLIGFTKVTLFYHFRTKPVQRSNMRPEVVAAVIKELLFGVTLESGLVTSRKVRPAKLEGIPSAGPSWRD